VAQRQAIAIFSRVEPAKGFAKKQDQEQERIKYSRWTAEPWNRANKVPPSMRL
jgi:hypothetical protein